MNEFCKDGFPRHLTRSRGGCFWRSGDQEKERVVGGRRRTREEAGREERADDRFECSARRESEVEPTEGNVGRSTREQARRGRGVHGDFRQTKETPKRKRNKELILAYRHLGHARTSREKAYFLYSGSSSSKATMYTMDERMCMFKFVCGTRATSFGSFEAAAATVSGEE